LIAEDSNAVAQELDLLVEVGEIGNDGIGAALLSPVDFVHARGQRDERYHGEYACQPQCCIPIVHVFASRIERRAFSCEGFPDRASWR
jgi:hypothetical protein